MKIDTVIDSKDTQNLTIEQCKIWWENQQVKDYFGEKELGNPKHFHLSIPKLIKQIGLTKDSHILEIGCGYGRETYEFCKISDFVYGVDISKTAIELCKKNCPQAIIQEFDGKILPFDNNKFDFVYNCFVIQHMSKEATKELIKETIRILKKGGKFLFEFLGGTYCAGVGKENYSGGLQGMFNNGYTEMEINNLVKDIKLKKVFMEQYKIMKDGTTNIWLCCVK